MGELQFKGVATDFHRFHGLNKEEKIAELEIELFLRLLQLINKIRIKLIRKSSCN